MCGSEATSVHNEEGARGLRIMRYSREKAEISAKSVGGAGPQAWQNDLL